MSISNSIILIHKHIYYTRERMRCVRTHTRDLRVQALRFFGEVTTSLSKRDSISETSLLDRLDYSREPMACVVT